MLRRSLTAAALLYAALALGGCGSLNTVLSTTITDLLPHWAGGLPPGVPPRPTDPAYAEFERAQHAKALAPPREEPAVAVLVSDAIY